MSKASNVGKIFVGGLAPQTTAESLRSFFSAYGGVSDAQVMHNTDPMTGMQRSRGFGFVVFENPATADEVVAQRRVMIDEKSVEVKPIEEQGKGGFGGGEVEDPRKCFVGGLPVSCDGAKLQEYFSQYDPAIQEAKVLMDPTGRSRCFGYITFSDAEAAQRAIAAKDNHFIDGKWIDLKVCTTKGKGKGKGMKGKGGMKGFGMYGMGMGGMYGGAGMYGAGMYGGAMGAGGYGGYGMAAGYPGFGAQSGAPAGYYAANSPAGVAAYPKGGVAQGYPHAAARATPY